MSEADLGGRAQKLDLSQSAWTLLEACRMVLPGIQALLAYHRQTDPEQVSAHCIHLSSALLLWSMLPLALGVCLDFYPIARLITSQQLVAMALALLLLTFFLVFWIGLPWCNRSREGHGVPQ